MTPHVASVLFCPIKSYRKHFNKGGLDKLCSLGFHFKEGNQRLKKASHRCEGAEALNHESTRMNAPWKSAAKTFAATVGRALRRAGQAARKTARAHGTPIYVWQDGNVVAQKP